MQVHDAYAEYGNTLMYARTHTHIHMLSFRYAVVVYAMYLIQYMFVGFAIHMFACYPHPKITACAVLMSIGLWFWTPPGLLEQRPKGAKPSTRCDLNNTAMTPLTSALFCLDESQRFYKYMSKKNGPRLEKRAVNTQVYHVGCGFWVWIGQ